MAQMKFKPEYIAKFDKKKSCGRLKKDRTNANCTGCDLLGTDENDVEEYTDSETEKGCRCSKKTAEPKFFFRPVSVEPVFKGIFSDPIDDLDGFQIINKKMHKEREWGEDANYDVVMRHFGCLVDDPDQPQQLIFGWASVSVQEDGTPPAEWQGDIIKTEDLEDAAYNYVLNSGLSGIDHEWGTECGWMVESMMFTKEKMALLGIPEGAVPEGWWIGFYIPDPAVYKKVLDGNFNMFSIQGYGRRIPVEDAE